MTDRIDLEFLSARAQAVREHHKIASMTINEEDNHLNTLPGIQMIRKGRIEQSSDEQDELIIVESVEEPKK